MKYVLIVLLLFFVVWDVGWLLAGVPPLFPWQLKTLLREAPEDVLLVDVRTSMEYGLFHIPGAVNRPGILSNEELPEELRQAAKGRSVVLICMSGHRSPPAAKMLQAKLDAPVKNLTWGMLGWLAVFGPLERDGE